MPFVVGSDYESPGGAFRVNPRVTERFMAFMSSTASLQAEPYP